jgi:heat shock protein HslJ
MKLMRSALILVLALLTLATCSHPAALPSGEWRLESLNGNPLVEETQISLVFQDEQAGGAAGCNAYGSEVEASGEKIEFKDITMTLMACTDAGVMAQESSYLAALEAVDTYQVEQGKLALSGPGVALVYLQD